MVPFLPKKDCGSVLGFWSYKLHKSWQYISFCFLGIAGLTAWPLRQTTDGRNWKVKAFLHPLQWCIQLEEWYDKLSIRYVFGLQEVKNDCVPPLMSLLILFTTTRLWQSGCQSDASFLCFTFQGMQYSQCWRIMLWDFLISHWLYPKSFWYLSWCCRTRLHSLASYPQVGSHWRIWDAHIFKYSNTFLAFASSSIEIQGRADSVTRLALLWNFP